jgi:hypothetical protein
MPFDIKTYTVDARSQYGGPYDSDLNSASSYYADYEPFAVTEAGDYSDYGCLRKRFIIWFRRAV